MDTTIWVALISQTPAIIAAIGVLVIGVLGARKLSGIHTLVNSQFTQAKAEIQAGNEKIAALERRIAMFPLASIEDKVRAEISTEIALAPLPLPKNATS